MKSKKETVEYFLPTRILLSEGMVNGEALLREGPLAGTNIHPEGLCSFPDGGYLLLDFGKELRGGVRLLTSSAQNPQNLPFRFRFGESVGETSSELRHDEKDPLRTATNDHAPRDFEALVPFLSDLHIGDTGFRFLRIDIPKGVSVSFRNIYAFYRHPVFRRLGSFRSSDENLNRIFDTAAYTLELNMGDVVWDGIKRDRLVWVGDMHPEMLGIVSLFGKSPIFEDSLRAVVHDLGEGTKMNYMETYSFWFPIILSDYCFFTNRLSLVREMKGTVVRLADYLLGVLDSEGKVKIDFYFLDWPSLESEDRFEAIQALYALSLEASIRLYGLLGLDPSKLKEALARVDRKARPSAYKQINAFLHWAKFLEGEEIAARQTEGGAKGFSTFLSYYILESIAESVDAPTATALLEEYYSGMLKMGATSFWEDYDLGWNEGCYGIDSLPVEGLEDIHGSKGDYCYKGYRHSLCHGWSCGPIFYLMKYVLGVRFLEPGGTKILLSPSLGDLSFVKGSVPTSKGVVTIEHHQKNGKLITHFHAPKGVEIMLDESKYR